MGPEEEPRDQGMSDIRRLDRQELYEALSTVADLDALHDLVATRGVEVLDFPFPYLVVAARNRGIDARRRQTRETPIPSEALPAADTRRSLWDPVDLVVAQSELERTLQMLSSMDDRDVLVVWLSARGWADDRIAETWDELGFLPHRPSAAAIRKRRQRARQELRRRMAT